MAAIGRTNDAILYGARVTLWVRGDDAALAAIGPKVPANSSPAFGKPFAEVFEAAGRDFYKIDPHLFSPAEITFCNLDTGKVQRFGKTRARNPADFLRPVNGWPSIWAGRRNDHEDRHPRPRESWYYRDLSRAAADRGYRCRRIDFPKLTASLGAAGAGLAAGDEELSSFDAVIVRTMPPGSLEQVVFRMDALWRLEAAGVVRPQSAQGDRVRRRQVSRQCSPRAGRTDRSRPPWSANRPTKLWPRSNGWGATLW